jgi:hypothetical protein
VNAEGDIVLIHYQDEPTMYARIESIDPDVKKDWYQVGLLLLTIPPQNVTWILREEYINGAPFTMGGNSMMLEEVKRTSPFSGDGVGSKTSVKKGTGKVIPLKKPNG